MDKCSFSIQVDLLEYLHKMLLVQNTLQMWCEQLSFISAQQAALQRHCTMNATDWALTAAWKYNHKSLTVLYLYNASKVCLSFQTTDISILLESYAIHRSLFKPGCHKICKNSHIYVWSRVIYFDRCIADCLDFIGPVNIDSFPLIILF